MPLDNSGENHIPEAVRRQSRRADAIAREIGTVGVEPAELPAEPVVEPPVEPPVELPAEPVVEPPVQEPPVADWESRYNTLQGKYNAEVPQLRNRVASMERLVAEMTTPPAPSVPTAATTVVDIPVEDREAFGEDLIAASQRWAAAKFGPEIDALRREIGDLRSGQQNLTSVTAQQRVMNALDADPEIPNWRQVNDDPAFIDWLNQVDPFSGEVRMRLLAHAYDHGDAVRCGRFFKTFIAEHTATTLPPAPTPPHTPPAGDAGRPSLESLAAPGRAAGTGPSSGAPAEKRVWTHDQITAFYRDCTQGKYAHREAERLRLEADLFLAAPEGRLR